MSKFCELVADHVLEPKVEALIMTKTVSNLNWLYMPKFVLARRVSHGGSYATPPVHFRSELTTPLAPDPFVIDQFDLEANDLRRQEGITLWGYKDKFDMYAQCDVTCRIRVLISCIIEQAYERDPAL